MWRSLVAHFVRDEGAGGSNPLIPIDWEYRGAQFSGDWQQFLELGSAFLN